MTIWLNGHEVLDVERTRAAHPDQNVAQVHLKKGRSRDRPRFHRQTPRSSRGLSRSFLGP